MQSKPKYIIDNKPDLLTDEEIKSTKDFKKLTYQYQKATTPLYKTPLYRYKYRRVFMAVLLIILVIWAIILMTEKV
jgi:hypothetical protein